MRYHRHAVTPILLLALGSGCASDAPVEPSRPPVRLAFAAVPAVIERGQSLAPALQVVIQDSSGQAVSSATAVVTVALAGTPGNAQLSGTTTVTTVNGVATFSDLRVDSTGSGYTIAATSPALSGATSLPFDVVLPFVQISAGSFHTCGVTTDSVAYCWGSAYGGAIGDSATVSRDRPTRVAGNHRFSAISVGYFSCGLVSDGSAWCWGRGDIAPVQVPGGLTFTTIETGNLHACALTSGGAAYCWGSNFYGSLGDSTFIDATTPVAVRGGLQFSTLSVGAWHTCALTPSQEAYCWGNNSTGVVGDSSRVDKLVPVPVSGQHHFAQISAGRHHTCGVSDSGESFCWGLNDWGQLGNADTVASTVPVGVSGPVSLVSVSAGGDYTCGLTSAGAAHCWGRNTFGVLGAGAGFYSDVPMEVQGGVTFASLSTGISQHNCGFRPGGAAYCWGSGSDGQLGSGVIGAALVPTAVGAP